MLGRWVRLGVWSIMLICPTLCWSQEALRTSNDSNQLDQSHVDFPLKLTRTANRSNQTSTRSERSTGRQSNWGATAGGLVVVITLIIGCGYLLKRSRVLVGGTLSDEILQVLGRKALDGRTTLHLVRCGSKILLLSSSAQHGVRSLTELTDPVETAALLADLIPDSMRSTRSGVVSEPSRTTIDRLAPQTQAASPGSVRNRGGALDDAHAGGSHE